jgi:hypothetical protein
MKKFINSVDTFLSESLAGFAAIHHDIVALGETGTFVWRAAPPNVAEKRPTLARRGAHSGPRKVLRRADHRARSR